MFANPLGMPNVAARNGKPASPLGNLILNAMKLLGLSYKDVVDRE